MEKEKIMLIISLIILIISWIILQFAKDNTPKEPKTAEQSRVEAYYNCVDTMTRNFKDIDNCNNIK